MIDLFFPSSKFKLNSLFLNGAENNKETTGEEQAVIVYK